jgi:tetratricopeptide (TPR) repeat protein
MNSFFLRDLLCSLCLVLFIVPSVVAQNPTPPTAAPPSETETSDLAVGKVRQALATQRALIANHPEDPSNYVNLAYTLTDAGITDQARQEVLKATTVAPQSAFAYNAQAWVLHHNVIGVDYGKGFDYDASLASYRKAIELDPNDLDLRQSLANLLEFNRKGIRYAPDAQLAEAIEILRYVKGHQSAVQPEVEDNLIIDLFYAGRFGEVLPELATLPTSPVRDGIAIAAIAAVQGPAAAIERANQIGGDEQKKKDALNFAAEGLWNMRLYPQAADILTASLPDTSNSKALIGKIQIFRNLRPYKGADLPATDPRSPVQRLIIASLTNTLTEAVIAQCVSRNAFTSEADSKRSLSEINLVAGMFRNLSKQTGLPQVVIQDIVLGTMKINIVPSKEAGSRIVVEFAGLPPQNFFVLSEGGSYRVVASNKNNGLGEIGTEALSLLHQDQEAEATALLNWKRDLVQKEQGDDPLGGSLFARLWTTGQSKGPQAIELAAASLSTEKSVLLKLLPRVIAVRKSAITRNERDNLDLLLASIYLRAEDGTNAKLISQRLLDGHSDSATAVALTGQAYSLTKSWSAWKSLLDVRLQRHPNDRNLLLQTAAEAEAEGDLPRARRAFRTLLDNGHALADDYNMYAWLSLFEDNVDDQALAAAQQANLLSKNSNYAYLHTLACLNAARGETAEARQLLLEAMSTGNLEEPNSAIWYGFGRIYEKYDVDDAAAAAYQRVERPDGVIDPTDTFVLAQSRLKVLHAN